MGEGYISGHKGKNKDAFKDTPFLMGKKLLPTTAFTESGIDKSKLETVKEDSSISPRPEENFTPPLFLIHENEKLFSAFWDECDLVYKHQIVGIYGAKNSPAELKKIIG